MNVSPVLFSNLATFTVSFYYVSVEKQLVLSVQKEDVIKETLFLFFAFSSRRKEQKEREKGRPTSFFTTSNLAYDEL